MFPELRKQREDKERFNRVGARIKSEADLEEIMDGLQEQEVTLIKKSLFSTFGKLHFNLKIHKVYVASSIKAAVLNFFIFERKLTDFT